MILFPQEMVLGVGQWTFLNYTGAIYKPLIWSSKKELKDIILFAIFIHN